MLSQKTESFSISSVFYHLDNLLAKDDPGVNSFEVTTWHLEHNSRVGALNQATASFDSSHIEITKSVGFSELCVISRQLAIQIVNVEFVHHTRGCVRKQ